MRDDIINYLKAGKFSFTVTNELPFSNSGDTLYSKNVKKVYVDKSDFETDIFLPLMNGSHVYSTTEIIRVFFSNDSKQTPKDYDDFCVYVKEALNLKRPEHFEVSTTQNVEHDGDKLITSVILNYRKITENNNGN